MNITGTLATSVKVCVVGILFLVLTNPINAQPNENSRKSKAHIKLEEARETLTKALAGHDSLWIADCYYVLGKRFIGLENFIQARHNLLRSIAIRQRYGPSEEIARAYIRLAECEFYEKEKIDFDNVLQYVRQIFYNSRMAKSHFGLMNGYRTIGSLHIVGLSMQKKGRALPFSPSIDSAFHYQNKALKMAIALRMPIDIALGYDILGSTWADLGDHTQTISYKKQAIALYTKQKRMESSIEPYMQLGRANMELGKYRIAKFWFDKSKSLADSCYWRTYTYSSDLANSYYKYYMAVGDLAKAIKYQKEEYEEKLKGEESYRNAAIEGLTLSVENDRKDYKLVLQGKELENRREKARLQSWLIVSAVLMFVLACIVAFLSHRLYRRYKIRSRRNEHLFLEQSHRIKNNLQTISDLLQLQLGDLNEPKAVQVIEESVLRVEAMSLIHKRLYGKDRNAEIEMAEYIVDLVGSALRSYDASGVVVSYSIDAILLHADKAIPLGLIINELASNACKYAFNANPEPRLSVGCYENDGAIFLQFEDNGRGFESQRAKNSFGLELIRIWVANLKGESSFTFESGTRFTLSFNKTVITERSYEVALMR